MGIVILQLCLTMLNSFFGFSNFEEKNYKSSCFNFFVAGVCFAGFIVALSKL